MPEQGQTKKPSLLKVAFFSYLQSLHRPIGGVGRVFHCFIASRSRKQSSDFALHSGHQQRHMPQLLVLIFVFPQSGHGSKIPCRVHSSCACRSPSSARRSRSVIVCTFFPPPYSFFVCRLNHAIRHSSLLQLTNQTEILGCCFTQINRYHGLPALPTVVALPRSLLTTATTRITLSRTAHPLVAQEFSKPHPVQASGRSSPTRRCSWAVRPMGSGSYGIQ